MNLEFEHIPEYRTDEVENFRVVALVRLEQFLDETTITPGVIQDLKKIRSTAKQKNEIRLHKVANLILEHCQRYS